MLHKIFFFTVVICWVNVTIEAFTSTNLFKFIFDVNEHIGIVLMFGFPVLSILSLFYYFTDLKLWDKYIWLKRKIFG